MGVVNYDSIEGEIYGDSDSGQYLRDALGSVTGTASSAEKVPLNTYRYRPSGLPLASTGTEPDPRFKWVGTAGYRDNPTSHSQNYVRARHYGQNENTWTTVDPLWPQEPKYQYALGNPVTINDRSGLQNRYPNPAMRDLGNAGMAFACAEQAANDAMAAAETFCQKNFGVGNMDGTICNAFQHCMWSCLIAQKCAPPGRSGFEFALEVTNMHEEEAPAWWPLVPSFVPCPWRPPRADGSLNPKGPKCMDLFNNRQGINCRGGSCSECCTNKALFGDLQIVAPLEEPKRKPPGFVVPRTDCKKNPESVKLPGIQPVLRGPD